MAIFTDTDLEKAIELRKTGLSYAKIGKEIGFTGATVMKKLNALKPKTDTKVVTLGDADTATTTEATEVATPEPKKATKPWEDKPWVPDRFRLTQKHTGFTPRFVTPENVQKRTDEGFQMADMRDYGYNPDSPESEQGQIDTVLRRHGMILMEMPDELMARKRAYIRHKTDNQDTEVLKKRMLSEGNKIDRGMTLREED